MNKVFKAGDIIQLVDKDLAKEANDGFLILPDQIPFKVANLLTGNIIWIDPEKTEIEHCVRVKGILPSWVYEPKPVAENKQCGSVKAGNSFACERIAGHEGAHMAWKGKYKQGTKAIFQGGCWPNLVNEPETPTKTKISPCHNYKEKISLYCEREKGHSGDHMAWSSYSENNLYYNGQWAAKDESLF